MAQEENKKEDNINGYGYDVTTTDFQLFEKAEEKQVEQSLNFVNTDNPNKLCVHPLKYN